MNNKMLGTAFEHEVVKRLSEGGYWVHFISPDARGAQPFDIIAVKGGIAIVGDCKTSSNHIFRIDRLEWNQRMAFDKWLACGNAEPVIFVKYKDKIITIEYSRLLRESRIDLDKE